MKEFILYTHGGSSNHGCEALIRSSNKVFKKNGLSNKLMLFSQRMNEDIEFNIDEICEVYSDRINENSKIECIEDGYDNLIQHFSSNKIAFSIGGDNYCYKGYPEKQAVMNDHAISNGTKTVLWGCSIEPELLEDEEIVEDLKRYSLITARETITYRALRRAGLTNVRLYPDSAFCLDKVELELPKEFIPYNTVGINISPLIEKYENEGNITYNNYLNLIEYIINDTDMNVALIPHVVREGSNDLEPLRKLYDHFKETNRICIIDGKYNCMELKGFISRLKMLVAARTHASIAGYSECVPTLVVGYSVKAIGIARDLFGTDENYVKSVQELDSDNEITRYFKYIEKNCDGIKQHLERIMPKYSKKALKAGVEVKRLIEEQEDMSGISETSALEQLLLPVVNE